MRLPRFRTILFAAMLAASLTANAQAGRWPPADMLDRVYENAGPDELTAAGIMAAIGAGHSRYPVEDFFLRALERDPTHLLAAHSLLVHCARQSNVPICGNELFLRRAVDNDETNGSLWAAYAAARYRYAGPEAALPFVRRAAEAQTYDNLFQSYLALFNDFLRGARILPTHHLAFMMAFSGRSVIEVRMYGICQSEAGAEWTAACLQLGRTIEGNALSSVADVGLRLQISMLERGGDPEQLRAARERQEALARTLAVQVFHPQLHLLIEGPPEERRRFLDFGVFHVEQSFVGAWREYRRCLRQRNAALRQGVDDRQVRLWDRPLVAAAEMVTAARRNACDKLDRHFRSAMKDLAPELGVLSLDLYAGWRRDASLAEVLAEALERERAQTFTASGPHRADLRVRNEEGAIGGVLSRGQQKTVVLGLTLALHTLVLEESGRCPVLCIDDFSSELDADHQSAVYRAVEATGAQVLMTGVEKPAVDSLAAMFHVEQGQVAKVV